MCKKGKTWLKSAAKLMCFHLQTLQRTVEISLDQHKSSGNLAPFVVCVCVCLDVSVHGVCEMIESVVH